MAALTRAAIWDVDGTMIDTAELHFRAWVRLMEELGRPLTRAQFDETFGWRNPEVFAHLIGDEPGHDFAALGERKEQYYRDAARGTVRLLPGVRALLDGLAAAGFRQAVGSSAPRANLELVLAETGVLPRLGAVVASEDTSRGKPDPEVFRVAARRVNVQPEACVVLEDAVVGVRAARAAGMRVIGVAADRADALRQAGADLVVSSLEYVDAARLVRLLGGT